MNQCNNTPLSDDLLARIVAVNPMQESSLSQSRGYLKPAEALELECYLAFCLDSGLSLADLAHAYQTITLDTMREQFYFKRYGTYRYSTFKEVADKVYFDDDYMTRYMYGLAITLYLWPNHLQIVRFFRETLPRFDGGRYLEVGPGHGVFMRHAVHTGGFDLCLGVDLSPTSLDLTRRLLSSDRRVTPDSWALRQADFLCADNLEETYDAIVMGEVLEHVEQPKQFLERIAELASAETHIFITTAVNAPAVDHIYLYRSVDEVVDQAAAAGLKTRKLLATPYSGLSMERTVAENLPINVAIVLGK